MPTKTLYHGELRKLSPVRVTVKSDVLESKYAGKPPYVVLAINGDERNYTTENQGCAAFFDGRKGETFTLIAEGQREEATITYVGESAAVPQGPIPLIPATQLPHTASKPPGPPQSSPPSPKPPTKAKMRLTEIRYDRTINTGNYCNEKIGVTLQVEDGAKADDVLFAARAWVDKHAPKEWKPEPARIPEPEPEPESNLNPDGSVPF